MQPTVRVRVVVAGITLALASAGSGCSTTQAPQPAASANPVPTFDPRSATEVLGLGTAVGPTSPALVVMVPGGSWTSADPSGLAPLARALVDDGAIVATTTYRTASDGVFFPDPARDVACSLAAAAAMVSNSGREADQVVILGHSAGAHLAALVALRGSELSDDCPDPPVAADALVGLAGPYDVTRASQLAQNLFGPDNPDPADWEPGNPLAFVTDRPELPVLLVHGKADNLVPVEFTTQFADALTSGGHDVTTDYPVGIDHASVYSAEVAGPVVAAWLDL